MEAINDLIATLEKVRLVLNFFSIFYGVGTCFLGFKFFRVQIAVVGFLNGGSLGYILGYIMGDGSEFVAIVCTLIVGGLYCLVAYKLYLFSVFVCTFGLGTIGLGVLSTLFGGEFFSILTVVGGVIVGVMAIFLVKPVIIVTTGLVGGLLVGSSLGGVIGLSTFFLVLGLLLGAVGVFFQWKDNSDDPNSIKLPQPIVAGAAVVAEKAKQLGDGMKETVGKVMASEKDQELQEKTQEKTQEIATTTTENLSPVSCPHCGETVKKESNFCRSCGKSTENFEKL